MWYINEKCHFLKCLLKKLEKLAKIYIFFAICSCFAICMYYKNCCSYQDGFFYTNFDLNKPEQQVFSFFQKCPISSAKKWHFERPNLRTDSKNFAKHPPKWWTFESCVYIFGRVSSQFCKIPYFPLFWSRFTFYMGPKFQIVVYMSFLGL